MTSIIICFELFESKHDLYKKCICIRCKSDSELLNDNTINNETVIESVTPNIELGKKYFKDRLFERYSIKH